MSVFNITLSEGVSHLRFTRPDKSNAMGGAFWSTFEEAITELDRAGQTRVLVISGEGKNFCAGMDLSVFAEQLAPTGTPIERDAFYHLVKDMQRILTVLDTSRFPVIAAIQGACIGAGLDLVAACDLRVVSSDAYFRLEEINIGMMADIGVLQRLPRLIPEGVAREMAYLGNSLTADRARDIGFANQVETDAEAALNAALAMARSIAAKAPLAIAGTKASMNYARDHSVADALDWCAMTQAAIWKPEDIMASVMARAKKQVAPFEDLNAIPPIPGSKPGAKS